MSYKDKLNSASNKWAILFIGTIVAFLPFYHSDVIKVPKLGKLQFSRKLEEFNALALKLSDAIYNNLLYDVVFIAVYTLFFYFAFKVFELSSKASFTKRFKMVFVIPGILDLLENLLTCHLLSNPDKTLVFDIFFWVVRAKFTVIIPFVIINFTIVIYYLIKLYDAYVIRKKERQEHKTAIRSE
ncbi:hypothetical protein MTsPCn5_05650 [Croceitalea sp. MTPC5]|uniref:hypothetical protein n=1 Tax=Croceitalea sp. MTPC5 TaxID=3056565 RepID=UPI002B3E9E38|nr:hypothetical protein MTsPCn5_05650 [Croceitalea sp. MTPC5]